MNKNLILTLPALSVLLVTVNSCARSPALRMSDPFRLTELKRQKLRLKEEIELMRRERGPIPLGTH